MEDMPWVASNCNRLLGEGSYRHITHRLHPLAASVVSSLLLAGVAWYTRTPETQTIWGDWISYGFAAFALAMTCAHLLSRRYPPILY